MMMNFEELLNELNKGFEGLTSEKPRMKSDVIEYKDGYLVLTDIPGVAKDRIELSFDKNVLKISVKALEDDKADYKMHERALEYQDKEIYLDSNVDYDNASAQLENGVLRVYLPKITKKSTSIKID